MSYLLPTYKRQPISFAKGQGSFLFTADGTPYLDALMGIAVCGLGHCHLRITQALSDQAKTLVHTSNLFGIDWQEKAGEKLCHVAGMDKVFFANSGAEANEAALKMARLFAKKRGQNHARVIVMDHSFHGRTLLTVSATANPVARDGFFTLDDDFVRVPFGDITAIEQALNQYDDICAIMLEPIQGESGVRVADNGFDFLAQVRQVCNTHDLLMILDEVQTGNGRTGKYFAYQHSQIKPDILTTAKGLGNGFPVGACMTSGQANAIFTYGSHGSTYGGTPLACRIVNEVIDTIHDEQLLDNVAKTHKILTGIITDNLAKDNVSIRGKGMMLGVVLPTDRDIDFSSLVDKARDKHRLIINVSGGNIIRLLPALNMNTADTEEMAYRLVNLIKAQL
ncbi:acetylornithine aminotransferase [Moraxella macacae 0408225]|uniref:Acetylornithine aminotransferase n=1 Tax=Moraxella macacae 0408225 TaxID=1230338 RepID=L2F5C0_9GAMM|nr:aspartate aminotransferase family protein [Moraxella macacae]ELA08222.1 acetylornithine aminotransferase [Moraxella macacae 0408225]